MTYTGSHWSVLLTKYSSGDHIEKNERGGAWSKYEREERCIQVFWWGDLRESEHLEDPSTDGRIILIWISKKWDGGKDWIDLARNWDRWRALVRAVLNVRAPQNAGNFLTSCKPVSLSRMTLLHGCGVSYECLSIGPPICM